MANNGVETEAMFTHESQVKILVTLYRQERTFQKSIC